MYTKKRRRKEEKWHCTPFANKYFHLPPLASHHTLNRTHSFSPFFFACIVPSHPPPSVSLEKLKPFFKKRKLTAQWRRLFTAQGSLAPATSEAQTQGPLPGSRPGGRAGWWGPKGIGQEGVCFSFAQGALRARETPALSENILT